MNGIVQQKQDLPAVEIPIVATSSAALILDEKSMQRMEALADMMASGRSTVPSHLQKSKGDCMAVIMQAMQWGMNPFAVAQKTHVVSGQLGYEGQLVNAVISTSGALKGRPEYEWFGPWENVIGKFAIRKKKDEKTGRETEFRLPGWSMSDEKGCGIRVWATLKGEEVPRMLELLLEQAAVRNSPLWASDPKQQLAYLAVKRWSRLYAPDVILGVYTPDELEEAPMKDLNTPLPKNAKPEDYAKRKRNAESAGPSKELLEEARTAAEKGRDAFQDFWRDIQPKDRGALRDEINDLQNRVTKAEHNRTIDMPAQEQPQQQATTSNPPPVDDEFIRQMDAAAKAQPDNSYVPE